MISWFFNLWFLPLQSHLNPEHDLERCHLYCSLILLIYCCILSTFLYHRSELFNNFVKIGIMVSIILSTCSFLLGMPVILCTCSIPSSVQKFRNFSEVNALSLFEIICSGFPKVVHLIYLFFRTNSFVRYSQINFRETINYY